VSLTSSLEHLGIDSTPVVANPHAQLAVTIFKFKLHALGSGMTKSVEQSLPADTVNLMLKKRLQRLLPAGDNDAKLNIGRNCKFLLNAGQGQNQVQGARVRPEAMKSVPALLDSVVHELNYSI
jgi:hypothetical protein